MSLVSYSHLQSQLPEFCPPHLKLGIEIEQMQDHMLWSEKQRRESTRDRRISENAARLLLAEEDSL